MRCLNTILFFFCIYREWCKPVFVVGVAYDDDGIEQQKNAIVRRILLGTRNLKLLRSNDCWRDQLQLFVMNMLDGICLTMIQDNMFFIFSSVSSIVDFLILCGDIKI